jgi:hypothetical protein
MSFAEEIASYTIVKVEPASLVFATSPRYLISGGVTPSAIAAGLAPSAMALPAETHIRDFQ